MSRIPRLLLVGSLCGAVGSIAPLAENRPAGGAEPATAAQPADKPDDVPRYTEVRRLPREVTLAHLSNGEVFWKLI